MEEMNMFFMILAFVGMYSCGFITCLLIVFGTIMHQQNRELKRKKRKEGEMIDFNKRTEYRSGNVQ